MNKLVKGIGVTLATGAVIFALTYNSKMVEIKQGVDVLKGVAIEFKTQSSDKDKIILEKIKEIEELQKQLDEVAGTEKNTQFLKNKIEQLEKEVSELEETNNGLIQELQKANGEIEKANAEQEEILNYINAAIEEVSK